MTDKQIEEIYAVVREAFNGGQRTIQFQSYPFRMTPDNMARFRNDTNISFWKNLKEGSDSFEVTKREPRVGYCGSKYVFNAESGRSDPNTPCSSIAVDPSIASAVAAKQREDDRKVAELVQRGTPAVAIRYADGSQNESFRNTGIGYDDNRTAVAYVDSKSRTLGNVSRPEAINDVQEFDVNERGQPAVLKTEVAAVPANRTSAAAPRMEAKNLQMPEEKPSVSFAEADKSSGASRAVGSMLGAPPPQLRNPYSTSTIAKGAAVSSKPFYERWFGLSEEAAGAEPNPRASVLN